jgi:hypothetical protein
LADEVIGQVLDGRVGVTGNGGLRVVTDDDGLLGLGDRDTFSASSGIDASILGPGQDETLASDKEAIGEGGIFGPGITLDDGRNDLQLVRFKLRTCVSAVGHKKS